MEELAIKINICGRIYPLRAKREDEALMRNAAKSIEEKLHKYAVEFGIEDKQDLLAMALFDFTVEASRLRESNTKLFDEQIKSLIEVIDSHNRVL